MARLGRAQAFAPFQFGAIAEAGADVTVALSGQAVTFALGTLLAEASRALTGAAVTGAQGTLVPALSKALSGSVITAGQGTVRVEGAPAGDGGIVSIVVRRNRLLQ